MKLPIRLNTIFARMFLFNVIMIILATLIPQTVFFNYFYKSYEKDTKTHNYKNAVDIKNNLDDTILEKVVNLPNLYFSHLHSNDDFIFPLENNIRNSHSRILSLSQKINDVHTSMEFLDSIDIFYKEGNLLFIDSSIYFLDDISTGNRYAYEWISKYKNNGSNAAWYTNERINNGYERSVISYKRNIPYNAGAGESQAIVVLNLKQSAINKFVKGLDSDQEEYRMIVNGDDGKIVAHPDPGRIGMDISEDELGKAVLQSENGGTKDVKYDGKLMTVSYVKSGYNNWRYVSVVSIDAIYSKNRQMAIYMLVVCGVLFIVNVAMSFVFTKGAYRPFRHIVEKVVRISGVFYGNESIIKENEYRLLDRTFNNLAENIDFLNEKLEASKPIIHHNAVSRLVRGDLRLDGMKDIESLMGQSCSKNYIFSFIIKIQTEESLGFENRMLVNYTIIGNLKSSAEGVHIESISEDDKTIIGFVNFDTPDQRQLILDEMHENVAAVIKTWFVFCIGRIYAKEEDAISKSYAEACECQKYMYFMPQKCRIAREELLVSKNGDSKKHMKLLGKLEDSLRGNNENDFYNIIASMVEEMKTGQYHIDYCVYILNCIVSTVKTALISLDMDEVETFGYYLRKHMEKLNTIDEFRSWVEGIFKVVSQNRQNDNRSIINEALASKIKRYIDENIYNDLSLENISSALNISPYYLSRNFKVLMGMNFSEYMTEKKMICAEKLLLEAKLTVKEIAQKLGYNSIQHFIKIFKAKHVLTPKEYQKMKSGQ